MLTRRGQVISRMHAILIMVAITSGVVALLGSNGAGANSPHWYQIELETDETDEYHWAVGAKGLKGKPLGKICALVSLIAPAAPDAPYLEGRDSVQCGTLAEPRDWVSGNTSFGSGDSRLVVFTGLYRPIVRKVAFLLGGAERRVFLPRMAKVDNRQVRGIPRFRYFVAPLKGETCIRKVTLFDGKGEVIHRESEPPCRNGGNI